MLGHWGPGYEAFLAGVFRIAGPDPLAARIAQVVLSTGMVALIYGLARAAGGFRAARIAAAMAALSPTLSAYSQYFFSETLFVTLLTGAIYVLHRKPEGPARIDRITGGILFGLAALTRSVAFYFLPFWVGWLWLRRRREEARGAAIVLAVALLVILPWTLRNALQYRSFLFIDGTVGETLYHAFSNVPFNRDLGFLSEWSGIERDRRRCASVPVPDLQWIPSATELQTYFPRDRSKWLDPHGGSFYLTLLKARAQAISDLPKRQRCELPRALGFARDHPGTVLRHILYRLYAFWGPNSFLLRAIHLRIYPDGPLAPSSLRPMTVVIVCFYLLAMLPAILALGRSETPRIVGFTLLFGSYYTGIHMLAVAYSRYRLPLLPLAMVLASLWLARPSFPEGRARRIGVGAAALALLTLCLQYTWTRLWTL